MFVADYLELELFEAGHFGLGTARLNGIVWTILHMQYLMVYLGRLANRSATLASLLGCQPAAVDRLDPGARNTSWRAFSPPVWVGLTSLLNPGISQQHFWRPLVWSNTALGFGGTRRAIAGEAAFL